MSTYTDLHNRIKENVTILRKPGSKDDGMSPQRVVLVNPENQFYGTFNGAMNIKGGTLSDLTFVGGTIDGTTLKNATFLDGDTPVPIGEIAAAVSDHEQRLTQAEADIKTISAAHDSLSAGLSGAIDNLATTLDEKIDAAVDDIEKRISGAVDGIETLSSNLGELSTKVETLSGSMLNGVVYKGTLSAYRDVYAKPRNLFNDDPACCILEGLQQPLKNGWMWRVHLDPKNVGGYVTVNDPILHRSMQLGEGDYIIIKSHNPSKHEVVPDDTMRLDDFDVINAQDGDDAKLSVILKLSSEVIDVSAYFEDKTNDISTSLCSEISGLSSGIAEAISSEITAQMDQRYVKKDGDSISTLTVDTDLAVGGSTSLNGPLNVSADDTSLVVSDDEVNLKTRSQIGLQTEDGIGIAANGKIAVETRGPVVLGGSNLSAVFKNQIRLYNERGLDDLYVNDKSVQSSLIELSNALDDLKFDKVLGEQVSSQVTAIQGYVDELSGANGSEGIVKYLSNEISSLRSDEKFEMQLNKVDVLDPEAADGRYASIGHFLSAMLEPTVIDVRNNTGYVIEFGPSVPLSTRISISDGLGTTLGHGDTIYIHVLSSVESAPIRVPFADLVPYNRIDQTGNTFIIQAGVSRYEFEEQAKNLSDETSARVAADAYISAWIQQNFANTEEDNELTTTVLNQEISAKSGLSVDGAVYALSDLSAAKQLFVNNGQLAVKQEDDMTSVEVAADVVKLSGAEVEVGSGKSMKISVGEVEAIAATSSEVDIFSAVQITNDAVMAASLSTSRLSVALSDAIDTSTLSSFKELHDFESSSRISADEWLSGDYVEKIENLSIALSGEIGDLSTALSNEITALSTALSNNIDSICADLSTQIEQLSIELSTELSNEIEARISSDDALSSDYVERIEDLSIALSNEITALSTALSTQLSDEIEARKMDDEFLSNAISTKIWIEDRANDPSDISSYSDLSIVKIGKDEYEDLAIGPTRLCANVLYVVEADYIDSYGQEIKNVLSSTEKTNAATVGQVDAIEEQLCAYVEKNDAYISSWISSNFENTGISNDLSTTILRNPAVASGGLSANWLSVALSDAIDTSTLSSFKELYDYEISSRISTDEQLSDDYIDRIEDLSTALSDEIDNLSTALSNEITALSTALSGEISDLSTALSNKIGNLSTALSGEIDNLSTALSNEITALSTALSNNIDSICADLSVAISSKIWIEDRINGTISGHSDLSVVKMSRDSYEEIAVGSLCSNVLYVVESDCINAYGEKIANATMTDDPIESEAATQHYVDDKLMHKPDISSIETLSSAISATRQSIKDRVAEISSINILSSSNIADVISSMIKFKDILASLSSL